MPLRLDVRLCAQASIELARVASEDRNLDPPLLKDRIIDFLDRVKPLRRLMRASRKWTCSFVETGPEAPVQVPGFCLVVLISPHADAMVTAQHVAADRNCTLGAVGDWSLALHHEQFRERCKINL